MNYCIRYSRLPALVLVILSIAANLYAQVSITPEDPQTGRGKVHPYTVAWYLPYATPATFTIHSSMSTTIRSIRVTKGQSEFSVPGSPDNPALPFTIPANGQQPITVHFTPITTSTVSVRTGEIAVAYNNGADTIYVDLLAYILEGKIEFRQGLASTSTIGFGKVRLGTVSPALPVTIANIGTLPVDIGNGDPLVNSDTVLHKPPFIVAAGEQVPNAVRLEEATGDKSTTTFKARFAPAASHLGLQKGVYLVEAIQGGRFKRKPYDTLYAIGTGAVPNLRVLQDTVDIGQAAINTTVTKSVREFWQNRSGPGIPSAYVFRADIESVEIIPIQPATSAGEFSITRKAPFSIDENTVADETFSFRPTSGAPLRHMALVRVVYDSVGNDNKELFFVLRGTVIAPEVSSLERVIDFGEVVVNTTGTPVAPASLLTNTGTAALSLFTPTLLDPNNPKVFSLTASELQTTVPVGGTLSPAGLRFTPKAEQEYTASFNVQTNTGGEHSTIVFTLRGKGVLPGIQSNVTEVDFGRVRVGRTAVDSLYLRNTAPTTDLEVLGFAVSNPDEFTVAGDRSTPFDLTTAFQSIPVTFTPQRPTGVRVDSVSIDNTSQRRPSILLKGEAALGRMQAFEQQTATPVDTVRFGAVLIQRQQARTLTLRNTGTFAYSLTRLELTGTDADQFSLSATARDVALIGGFPDGFAVDTNAALDQAMSFFPTSSGDKHAVLRIIGLDPVSGLPEDTAFVALYGVGADLGITSDNGSDTLAFGDVLVGTTAVNDGVNDRFVTIVNPSNSDIGIESVTVQGSPRFTTTTRTITLPPGGSDTIRVYFRPAEATAQPTTAMLAITYADGMVKELPLRGRGVAPSAFLDGVVYTADPTVKTLSLTAEVGSTATTAVAVENRGEYPLTISGLAWDTPVAPWLAVDALPFSAWTLQPGERRDMTIQFSPTTQGMRTARLVFTSNHVAPSGTDSSTFAVVVSAEGVYTAPPLSVTASLNIVTGKPGDRVIVPVTLQSPSIDDAGIQRFEPVLHYDPSILIPRAVTPGSAAPGFTAGFTEQQPGTMTVTLTSGGSSLQNGTVAEIAFDVLLGQAVSSPLAFDETKTLVTASLPVDLTTADGMVVLSEFCAADRRLVGVEGAAVLALTERPDGPSLQFAVSLPTDDPATLTIYDSYGRTVGVPVHGSLRPGINTVTVEARPLSGGVYFAVLRSGTIVRTLRFAIVR